MTVEDVIARWASSGAAERANYQLFISDLCDLLGVERPRPSSADNAQNAYVFERSLTVQHGDGSSTTKFIDCYRRGCFVLEAKQGSDAAPQGQDALLEAPRQKSGTARRGMAGWDKAMVKAKAQAEFYVKALPAIEGRPPFFLVVDVGYVIEVYSEFSRSGGVYVPFPDPSSHRLKLEDLRREEVLQRLRAIWDDPLSLDPSRRAARATRAIADRLAGLNRSLERCQAPHCAFARFSPASRTVPLGLAVHPRTRVAFSSSPW